MGFLERMVGNLMGGKFGGHHGGYRGGHHGGSGHGGYRGNPGYPQDCGPGDGNSGSPCPTGRQHPSERCALLPAMRRFPVARQMFRLRRGTDGGRPVLRPVRQTPAVVQRVSQA